MLHYILGTNNKIRYDLSSIIREYDNANVKHCTLAQYIYRGGVRSLKSLCYPVFEFF